MKLVAGVYWGTVYNSIDEGFHIRYPYMSRVHIDFALYPETIDRLYL